MMIFIMAAAGMYIEMRVVNSVPVLGSFLERFRVGALVFSLALSAGLGMIFGATGLIVFASGVLSTIMIQPWYAMRRNGTLDKVRVMRTEAREKYDVAKARYYAKKDLYVRRARQIYAVAVFIVKVVSFPFVVIGKVMDGVHNLKMKFAK